MRRLVIAAVFCVPIIELVVAIAVGRAVGAGWTLLALVVLSLVGATVVRRQGVRALADLRDAARERRTPPASLKNRGVLAVGGVLMALPGFVTAALSLPFLLPGTRGVVRRGLSAWFVRHGSMRVSASLPDGIGGSRYAPHRRTTDPRVVPGEVVEDE